MQKSNNGGGSPGDGRNSKGQWTAGTSGNPNGRPHKKEAVPKSYEQMLAAAWAEKVPTLNSQGKLEMVPAIDAFVRKQVRSMLDMKPTEQRAALKSLDDLGKTLAKLHGTGTLGEKLTREQLIERIQAHLDRLIKSGEIKMRSPEQRPG